MTNATSKRVLTAAFAAWGIACAVGFTLLLRYSNTPGKQSEPSHASALPIDLIDPGGRPTLVMYAHPRCPCTRASFSELERLQTLTENTLALRVVFFEPAEVASSWRQTDLWRRAENLPHAQVIPDPDGRITHAAGARTSGTVALYDSGGGVLFWGGLTSSRGHEGTNLGHLALLDISKGMAPRAVRTEVYGCALFTPGAVCPPDHSDLTCGVPLDE